MIFIMPFTRYVYRCNERTIKILRHTYGFLLCNVKFSLVFKIMIHSINYSSTSFIPHIRIQMFLDIFGFIVFKCLNKFLYYYSSVIV